MHCSSSTLQREPSLLWITRKACSHEATTHLPTTVRTPSLGENTHQNDDNHPLNLPSELSLSFNQQQMADVKSGLFRDMQDFARDFEDSLVKIYEMATEIHLGSYRKEKAESVIRFAGSEMAKLDRMITQFLANPILESDAERLFVDLTSSCRPQLEGALERLKAALTGPTEEVAEIWERQIDPESREIICDIAGTLERLKNIKQSDKPDDANEEEEEEAKEEEPPRENGGDEFISMLTLPAATEEEDASSSDSSEEESEDEESA